MLEYYPVMIGRKTRAVIMIFCLVMVPLLLSGCVAARMDDAAWQDKNLIGVWPQAPEKVRIRLQQVIRGPQDVVDASSGKVKKLFDYITGSQDEFISLYTPHAIAADGNGRMYIADPSIGIIHRYDLAAKEVQYIFQAGDRRLGSPVGIVLDGEDNLYVTDSQRSALYKYSPKGDFLREIGAKGILQRPAGIAVRSNGDKLVADSLADKVFIFGKDDSYKGELAGSDFTESFSKPMYIAVDKMDFVYVTDTMNFTVRVFDADNKYVRSVGQIGDVPGAFARPKGVALDSDRNLYVLDSIFANFQLFDQQDQLLLYVGQEGSLPGEFMLPGGIFIDKHDRIYVSDTFNHRIQIFQYLKEKVLQ
jgi:DNA-binding beta-propeller fold protein YncE